MRISRVGGSGVLASRVISTLNKSCPTDNTAYKVPMNLQVHYLKSSHLDSRGHLCCTRLGFRV